MGAPVMVRVTGVGMAAALLLDAALTRLVPVSATMVQLGDANCDSREKFRRFRTRIDRGPGHSPIRP